MGSIPIGSTEIWECIDEMCSLFVTRNEKNRHTLKYVDLTNAYNPGMRLHAAFGDSIWIFLEKNRYGSILLKARTVQRIAVNESVVLACIGIDSSLLFTG